MAHSDPRIGHKEPGGETVWPEVDVLGNPYDRPATTFKVGESAFVVLPAAAPKHLIDTAVEEVRAAIMSKAASVPRKAPGFKTED